MRFRALFESPAVGVGMSGGGNSSEGCSDLPSVSKSAVCDESGTVLVRVGDEPEAVPLVRGANGGSWDAIPLRVIPERGQVPENAVEPPRAESWDVLHDRISGAKLANDPSELRPKTRAGSVDPGSLAGEADVLAGEATADQVHRLEVVGADGADVVETLGIWKVLGEDGLAVGVELDLPGGLHPRPLEAEVEAADASEEGADIQRRPPTLPVAWYSRQWRQK